MTLLPTDDRLFVPADRTLLSAEDRLPADVYLSYADRFALFASAGAPVTVLDRKTVRGRELFIRDIDQSACRSVLPGAMRSILDRPDAELHDRYRRVYAMAEMYLAPVFKPGNSLDATDLATLEQISDILADLIAANRLVLLDLGQPMRRGYGWHLHALNSTVYALALASRLGLVGEDLHRVGRGCLLHDVGKMRLPASVLDRSGELDAIQWQLMRRHPELGVALVTNLQRGVTPSYADSILGHHERLDGSGYPFAKREAEISLAAQIVAVADVFDAMTCDRPHRSGTSAFDTLRRMRTEMAGRLSDRLIVEFIGLLGGRS